MRFPGFTAAGSMGSCGSHSAPRGRDSRDDERMHRVVAADVPGGPGNVPIGYSRECRRVPYTVCDANGCRTEYGWVCYFRPISRAW
jgi:hypothetical protein